MLEPMSGRQAAGGGWNKSFARAGFLGKGILYGIIGIVALAVALGAEQGAADQTGALRSLAGSGAGNALLLALAIGLGAYALFRLVEVFRGPANETGRSAQLERVASAFRFLLYGGLCVAAVRLLTEAGGTGGDEQETTSTVFSLPAGVAIVLVAGVVLIGVGLYQGFRSLSTSFEDELETARMGPSARRLARVLGVAGHASRAIIFVIVGGFLIKAAVEHDSSEAIGIDGALQELSRQTLGDLLLFAVAAGLVTYGAYCLVEARYRRV
jgi:hypothetical protein